MSSAAGAAAAAAASAAARAKREEEERLTMYREDELDQDWEFKIVRSSTGAFRNPDRLRQLLGEEALSGWEFLEKFDNYRVRLKRRRSAVNTNGLSPIDPYRSNFGISEGLLAVLIIAGVFATIFGLLIVANIL